MQGNNNGNGQKPSGLSWSTPSNASSQPARAASNNSTPPVQKNVVQSKPSPSAAPGTTEGKGGFTKWIIGGVVVGALLMLVWGASRPEGSPTLGSATTTEENGNEEEEASTTGGNTTTPTSAIEGLSIPTPQNAGYEVAISSVRVSQPTWVVVYETRNGEPGNALGAALIFPENRNGTVRLLRATMPGQTYFVGQSIDNGDRSFSLQGDERVRDVQGNPVWAMFTTR